MRTHEIIHKLNHKYWYQYYNEIFFFIFISDNRNFRNLSSFLEQLLIGCWSFLDQSRAVLCFEIKTFHKNQKKNKKMGVHQY